MDTVKPSEADILAQNAQLTTELASVRAQLKTSTDSISALTGENTSLKADKATLTTQLATANANLSTVTTERDTLKAEKVTVDKAAAAKVAQLGIVDNAPKDGANGGSAKKLTFTEKILAAKGCKTLEELAAKRQPAIE